MSDRRMLASAEGPAGGLLIVHDYDQTRVWSRVSGSVVVGPGSRVLFMYQMRKAVLSNELFGCIDVSPTTFVAIAPTLGYKTTFWASGF